MDNNNMYGQQSETPVNNVYGQQVQTPVVKCPGKEITGMIMGIASLYFGVFAILFFGSVIYGIIFGIIAIPLGIVAIVLHKQVHQIATVITKKINIGKNLAIAGIITGGVGILISIIVLAVAGAALLTSSGYYY